MSWAAFRALSSRWIPLVAVALCGCTPHTKSARAPSFAPYEAFEAMPMADLDSLRVKLTYVGPRGHITHSLAFAAPGTPVSLEAFAPFRRPGFHYGNDAVDPATFTASLSSLETMIDSVGTSSRIRRGNADPDGYLSFAMLSTRSVPPLVFEAIVNDTSGRELFARLLGALGQNADAVRFLRVLGCAFGTLPTNAPRDVRPLASVLFGGLRPDPSSPDTYAGTVRVTNASEAALPVPLTLVVHIQGNARLIDDDGRTCNIGPAGTPIVDLSRDGPLQPGATVERTLRFAKPGREAMNLSWGLYGGLGTP